MSQPSVGSIESLEPRVLFAAGLPSINKTVVVVLENHSYGQIIGNTVQAPYINALAASGASFVNSVAVTHPSQPNYIALFAGDTRGVTDDGPVALTGANLGSDLIAAGKTFLGYSEDLPYVGYTGTTYNSYDKKHAPWASFDTVPASTNHPFTDFPANLSDLPDVSFVIPNESHNMHDGTIDQGDTWVKNNIDRYVQWAKTNNSLLILTFDEADGADPNNQITTIFAGPMIKNNLYGEAINHYNVLRTIEDLYNLPHRSAAASAFPIMDAFQTVPPPPPPPPPADTTGPAAGLSATRFRKVGYKYIPFSVTFTDATAVNPATLDSNDFIVTGPNGFSRKAEFVSVNRLKSGTPRIAVYQVKAPGGQRWTASHNGSYTITMQAGQVMDTLGNASAAGIIGRFQVLIPSVKSPVFVKPGTFSALVVKRDVELLG